MQFSTYSTRASHGLLYVGPRVLSLGSSTLIIWQVQDPTLPSMGVSAVPGVLALNIRISIHHSDFSTSCSLWIYINRIAMRNEVFRLLLRQCYVCSDRERQ